MKQKLHVLVAQGNSREAAMALLTLFSKEPDGLELTEVSGVSTLMASLELAHPDVMLLELALVGPDPVGAVRRLHRAEPAVPLVVIGDPAEREAVAASLRAGAIDYLIKGQTDSLTVQRVLREAMRHNTLVGLADLLRDPLTGLFIRDGFLTIGARAMEAAKVKAGDLVLLCSRIDSLEAIQSMCGRNAADQSLLEIAKLLTGSFRRTDVLGRIGESHFAALAVDAVEPSAPMLVQRVQKRLDTLNNGRSPKNALRVCMKAGFWTAVKDTRTLSEFLDSVEAGLRPGAFSGVT